MATDSTITGDGTSGDPLKVASPFSTAMENKVTELPERWSAKVWAVGAQCLWNTIIYQCDTARTAANTTQPQSDSAWRPVGDLPSAVARLNTQGTLFSSYFPSYIATDAEVTAAVEALKGGAPTSMDTLKELADAIGLRLNDRGDYGSTSTYVQRDVVRHTAPGEAFYIARGNVPAGKTPGVASDWKTFWYRLGWAEGATGSHVGTPTYTNGVLSIRDRGGTAHAVTLAGGADTSIRLVRIGTETTLSAAADTATDIGDADDYPDVFLVEFDVPGAGDGNPVRWESYLVRKAEIAEPHGIQLPQGGVAGNYVELDISGGKLRYLRHGAEDTTVLSIFQVLAPKGDKGDAGPPGSLVEVGSANYSIATAGVYVAGSGDGIDISDVDDNSVLAFIVGGATLSGARLYWFLGNSIRDRVAGFAGTGDVDTNADAIAIGNSSATFRIAFGRDSNDKLTIATSNQFVDPTPLTLYKMGSTTVPPPDLHPSISSWAITSGNTSPVAGSIGTLVYGVAWAIAQSSHVGAARIVGFKGTAANPTSVAVLKTLTAAEYAHGAGSVTIPGGVSLAANETYSLRIEVYGENQDVATELPRSYQDARITAHAAATANYHIGRIQYRAADDTVAKQIARITDFTGDVSTSADAPSRITINAPDDSNEYQMYLIAKASETQPTGFTSNGLPATNSFYAAQDLTIATVAYKVYLLRQEWRVTDDDNGDFFGVSYA